MWRQVGGECFAVGRVKGGRPTEWGVIHVNSNVKGDRTGKYLALKKEIDVVCAGETGTKGEKCKRGKSKIKKHRIGEEEGQTKFAQGHSQLRNEGGKKTGKEGGVQP